MHHAIVASVGHWDSLVLRTEVWMYDCVDWVMRLSLRPHEVRMVSIYVYACAFQGLRF